MLKRGLCLLLISVMTATSGEGCSVSDSVDKLFDTVMESIMEKAEEEFEQADVEGLVDAAVDALWDKAMDDAGEVDLDQFNLDKAMEELDQATSDFLEMYDYTDSMPEE